MLQRSLHELAVGSLFGGSGTSKLLARLLQPLKGAGSAALGKDGFVDAFRSALAADLDARWPRAFRLNELESISEQVCRDNFLLGPDLPVLDALFDELMEQDGELICFRLAHVHAYMRMSAEIDPAILVGWRVAGLTMDAGVVDPRQLERTVALQTAFFSPRSLRHRPVAENHAHIGGTFGDGAVLCKLILAVCDKDLAESLTAEKHPENPDVLDRLRRARSLVHAFLLIWRQGKSSDDLEAIRHDLERASSPADFMSPRSPDIHWPTFVETIDVGLRVDSRWLLIAMTQSLIARDIETAWLWLFIALWRSYRDPEASLQERAAVLSIISEVSLLRRHLLMDGRGLRRFTERYYSPSMRGLAEHNAALGDALSRDVARRVFVEATDVAELKIAPTRFTPKLANALASSIDGLRADPMRGLLPPSKDGSHEAFREARRATYDRWHFCVHFSRRGDKGRSDRRATLWNEAQELSRTASNHSLWASAGLLNGYEHRDYHFEPGHFLRGLDVAGDETRWPIEIFAPALRWLRKAYLAKGNAKFAVLKPHLSVHAGEDYAHVLSGMRHLDETVRFCAMSRGDRLGHALAIGIRPKHWFARHGEVLLNVDDHLDNLVWAWGMARGLAASLPLAAQLMPRLEQRIRRFQHHVRWLQPAQSPLLSISSTASRLLSCRLDPADLFDAWQLRR